jgi:hypothetical protein
MLSFIVKSIFAMCFILLCIPVAAAITGDIDSDGVVSWSDLTIIIANLGRTSGYPAATDVKADGIINVYDLVLLGQHWGENSSVSDTTPPAITIVSPTGVLASGTTNTTLIITTNETATCKYGTTPNTAYVNISTTFTATNSTNHSTLVTGLQNGTAYTYYVRCQDTNNNPTTVDSVIAFNVSNTTANVSFVQADGFNDNTASATLTQAFTTNNVAGNTIIVAASWDTGGASQTEAVTDTQGNTYVQATKDNDATNQQSLATWYASNIRAGPNTVTVNIGSSHTFRRLIVAEYTGLAYTNALDVTAKNIAAGTTAVDGVTSTIATPTDGTFVFGAVTDNAGATTISAGTNFTKRLGVGGDTMAIEDKWQAGATAAPWTFGTAHRYIAHVAVFRTNGGALPPPPDTASPTTPTGLTATAVSSSQINLAWNASTDNVGVTSYKVFRCTGAGCTPTATVATPATNSYQNTGLSSSTTYTYRVQALDAASNPSGNSTSASATTQVSTGTEPEPVYNSTTDTLVFQDNLDGYADIVSMGAAPQGTTPRIVPNPSPVTTSTAVDTGSNQLVTGRGGTGKAMRMLYSGANQDSAKYTTLNVPATPNLATHYFTYWARITPNPAFTTYLPSIKWFELWHQNDRMQFNTHDHLPCPISGPQDTYWQIYDTGGRESTCQGNQPIGPWFADLDDGQWHRYTYQYRPNSFVGARDGIARMWIDGTKVLDVSASACGITPPGGYKTWCNVDDIDLIDTEGIAGRIDWGWTQTTVTSPWTLDVDDVYWWTVP